MGAMLCKLFKFAVTVLHKLNNDFVNTTCHLIINCGIHELTLKLRVLSVLKGKQLFV